MIFKKNGLFDSPVEAEFVEFLTARLSEALYSVSFERVTMIY